MSWCSLPLNFIWALPIAPRNQPRENVVRYTFQHNLILQIANSTCFMAHTYSSDNLLICEEALSKPSKANAIHKSMLHVTHHMSQGSSLAVPYGQGEYLPKFWITYTELFKQSVCLGPQTTTFAHLQNSSYCTFIYFMLCPQTTVHG